MKRFKFSLEALATIRRAALERSLEQCAKCLADRQRAVVQWEHSVSELNQLMDSRRAMTGIAGRDWEQNHRWQEVLEIRAETHRRDVQRSEEAVRNAQAFVFEARKEVEALERIRSRRLITHNQEVTRAEQKELDEIASRTVARALLTGQGHGKSLHDASGSPFPKQGAERAPSDRPLPG